MPFQLNAKNVGLTYSQCTVSKEDMLAHLRTLFPDAAIRVGHELHENGGHHLHVYIQSPVPIRTRDCRFFDYSGFHPKVESVRSTRSWYDYCGKENDVAEHGEFVLSKTKKDWSDVFTAVTPQEAMELIKDISPRDYVLAHERCEYYVRKAFEQRIEEYVPRFDNFSTEVFPQLQEWLDQINELGKQPVGGGEGQRHLPVRTRGPLTPRWR